MRAAQEKSKAFAVRSIRFHRYLCESKKEFVIARQLLKSGTSIGANVREAQEAQSISDFVSKMSIALKEACETAYWLEILLESEVIVKQEYDSLYGDCTEIIKLLTSIIKTARAKLNKKRSP